MQINKGLPMAIVIAILLLISAVSNVFADDYTTVENSSPQQVVGAMSTRLVRGVANTTTGWLEFPKQIYLTSKNEGIAKGMFVGPFKGIGMTIVRTVSGVLETATFLVPFPGFYDPYFDPAYVWQKE